MVRQTEAEIDRAREALNGIQDVVIDMQQLPRQGTTARDRIATDQSDPQQRADLEIIVRDVRETRRLVAEIHSEVRGPAIGSIRVK